MSLLLSACGPDGEDAASSGDDIGVEVIAGGDAAHDGDADDHQPSSDEATGADHGGDETMTDVASGEHSDHEADEEARLGMPAPDAEDVDEMTAEGHEDGSTDATHDETGEATVDEAHDGSPAEATHDEAHDDAAGGGTHDAAEAATADGMVVNVEMVDFGFVADVQELPVGEPVTFRFNNTGLIEHEAMFGSHHQQEEFAASTDHGGHGDPGHHGDVAAITLDPGVTADITLEFAETGEVWIGCHLPGHYDAGMVATFVVI